jgi:hypothetical protein
MIVSPETDPVGKDMAARRTNLALLALLAIALVTGVLSWAIGTRAAGAIVVAHGVAGLAIVLLSPWKGTIARRGMRRRRPGRAVSILLAALVVACVVTGLLHAAGLIDVRGPLSPLGLHVATGVGAVAVGVWHLVQRPTRPRTTDLSRRNLLRAGALAAGAGAAFLGVEGLLHVTGARGADRRFTGSHQDGSFDPDRMPVTQWFDDAVPSIDASEWRLLVTSGGVSRSVSLHELTAFDDRIRAVIDCTGGWYAGQDWQGARLDRLLGQVDGSSVLVRSRTGYERRFPIGDASSIVVATGVGGAQLSAGHGFPARLVAPGRRGYWWVKWIDEIRVDDTPWWWQPPFPLT